MYDINLVVIGGRLTRDPEQINKQEKPMIKFTVASNRGDYTVFMDCVAFGKTAEYVLENFKKGEAVTVIGLISQRKHEDQTSHKVSTFTSVIANEVHRQGKKMQNDIDNDGEV